MHTRYLRRRVWISYDGEEEALEATVLDCFRDLDCWFYRIKLVEDGCIIDVKSTSINYIGHCKSEVVKFPSRIRVVK